MQIKKIHEYRKKQISPVPVFGYHVSGEYAMIKAAAEKGWLNEDDAILEALTSIKRAGADLIAKYFVKDIIKILNSKNYFNAEAQSAQKNAEKTNNE